MSFLSGDRILKFPCGTASEPSQKKRQRPARRFFLAAVSVGGTCDIQVRPGALRSKRFQKSRRDACARACGCTDILMHTMERYFNSEPENLDLTDGISEALMRTVMENARILRDRPDDLKARAEVMWAGSLSHNGLTGCGTDGGDWATHLLEHEMGGMFDVAHGAGLAAIWGSWARYVWQARPDRFVKFARNVMGVTGEGSDAEIVERGIQAVEQFYRDIHMPTNMRELGIEPTDAQIAEMAEKSVAEGTVKVLNYEDKVAIYKMAR